MTPAEARQIDREEFEAECAAIRQRAYQYVAQRHHEARAEI
jgi:DNA-binding IclR family transcriptional regulator